MDYALQVIGDPIFKVTIDRIDLIFKCLREGCGLLASVRLIDTDKKSDYEAVIECNCKNTLRLTNAFNKTGRFSFTVEGQFAPKESLYLDGDVDYTGHIFDSSFPLKTTRGGFYEMSDDYFKSIAPPCLMYEKKRDSAVGDLSDGDDSAGEDGKSKRLKIIREDEKLVYLDISCFKPKVTALHVLVQPLLSVSEFGSVSDKMSVDGSVAPGGGSPDGSSGGSVKGGVPMSVDGSVSSIEKMSVDGSVGPGGGFEGGSVAGSQGGGGSLAGSVGSIQKSVSVSSTDNMSVDGSVPPGGSSEGSVQGGSRSTAASVDAILMSHGGGSSEDASSECDVTSLRAPVVGVTSVLKTLAESKCVQIGVAKSSEQDYPVVKGLAELKLSSGALEGVSSVEAVGASEGCGDVTLVESLSKWV